MKNRLRNFLDSWQVKLFAFLVSTVWAIKFMPDVFKTLKDSIGIGTATIVLLFVLISCGNKLVELLNDATFSKQKSTGSKNDTDKI